MRLNPVELCFPWRVKFASGNRRCRNYIDRGGNYRLQLEKKLEAVSKIVGYTPYGYWEYTRDVRQKNDGVPFILFLNSAAFLVPQLDNQRFGQRH